MNRPTTVGALVAVVSIALVAGRDWGKSNRPEDANLGLGRNDD